MSTMPTDAALTEQAILDVEREIAGQEGGVASESLKTTNKALDMLKGTLAWMFKGKDEKPAKGDGEQMSLEGLDADENESASGDDEDENDENDDEGMEKGICPRCHHTAAPSEFGLMAKGSGDVGMLTDDSTLISIVCAAVATEFEASGLSDMAKGMMLGAEVNQGLAESNLALRDIITEMRHEIDEMRKGQEVMLKGLTSRTNLTPAPSPTDLAAQLVAAQRTPERFAPDGETMAKGDGAPVRGYLRESEIAKAVSLNLMGTQELSDYQKGLMPTARILDIQNKVSAAA